MELWSYASKEWYSSPLFINTWILTLSFQTLEFLYCRSKHLNFGPIFYTWKFWCHRSKHWNSGPIFINIGILALSSCTLEFLSYPSKRWNSGPFFINNGILAQFYKHCNCYLIHPLQTLKFSPYTHWFSDGMLQNIRILPRFF